MPRPSQQLDQALLDAGRALYAELGCAGLSQRRVARHAGVSPGLLHYHFASKEAFLRALLQQLYEQMFAGLQAAAGGAAAPLERLRQALAALARFVRAQRPLLLRLAADAVAGEAVAREFVQANAPRHVGLLLRLMAEARHHGALREGAALQQFGLLMGAVMLPLLVAPALPALKLAPRKRVEAELCSDAAIDERIALALAALLPARPLRKARA